MAESIEKDDARRVLAPALEEGRNPEPPESHSSDLRTQCPSGESLPHRRQQAELKAVGPVITPEPWPLTLRTDSGLLERD